MEIFDMRYTAANAFNTQQATTGTAFAVPVVRFPKAPPTPSSLAEVSSLSIPLVLRILPSASFCVCMEICLFVCLLHTFTLQR